MSKPIDWTVGTPAMTLIDQGIQVPGIRVGGGFPLNGASPKEVRYRLDGSNITSYIVYDDNGRAIKRVDLTGKAHQGVATPHVVEYQHHQNPITGDIHVRSEKTARPARSEEIP